VRIDLAQIHALNEPPYTKKSLMKNQVRKTLTAACLLAVASTSHTYAALLAYDGFVAGDSNAEGEYLAGTTGSVDRHYLTGQSPTLTGFTGAWAQSITTFELGTSPGSSLSYSDGTNTVQTSGNSAFRAANAGTSSRAISADLSGTTYYSFMMKFADVNTNAGFILGEGSLVSNGGAFRLRGTGAGSLEFEAGFVKTDLGALNTDTYFFVIKLNAGANDTYSLWVNPTDLSSEGNNVSTLTATTVGSTSLDISHLTLFKGAGNNTNLTIDEVRIGTEWADVAAIAVPESSTYSLLAGSLVLLSTLMRRRR
jgi:hypothetical protein